MQCTLPLCTAVHHLLKCHSLRLLSGVKTLWRRPVFTDVGIGSSIVQDAVVRHLVAVHKVTTNLKHSAEEAHLYSQLTDHVIGLVSACHSVSGEHKVLAGCWQYLYNPRCSIMMAICDAAKRFTYRNVSPGTQVAYTTSEFSQTHHWGWSSVNLRPTSFQVSTTTSDSAFNLWWWNTKHR